MLTISKIGDPTFSGPHPGLPHSHGKKVFPYVQPDFSLSQLLLLASCPITMHFREDPNSIFSVTLFRTASWTPRSPSLLQVNKPDSLSLSYAQAPFSMASAGLLYNNVFLVLGYPNRIQCCRCGLIRINQGEWPLASAYWLKLNPTGWTWSFEHDCGFVFLRLPEVFTNETQKTQSKKPKRQLVW